MTSSANVQNAVPFFMVTSIEASLRYYVDGLGFTMKNTWINEGKLEWCSLEIDAATIMLQEYRTEGRHSWRPEGKLGQGVSICFVCKDAVAFYREVTARGISAGRPFVGNGMWVTSLTDPDGYRIDFESYTDVPEETVLADA